MAIEAIPQSAIAQDLLKQIDEQILHLESRESMIEGQMQLADSLINYDRIDQAVNVLRSLKEYAPDHEDVSALYRKAMFEKWRNKASDQYSQGRLQAARLSLDSALVLFPGHTWCQQMLQRIDRELSSTEKVVVDSIVPARRLSPEIQKEIAVAYELGQNHFKEGQLAEAIAQWERVELLAPDYLSVRTFLVNAYKYVGIEHYSQNKLEDAIEAWQKAARLNPQNAEIKEYIDRTQSEIRNLRELSYGR
jgi:tetratricopeptide (TPR) repeat protein